jgi:ssDNA-binding Zn-finger/Zn-ribbon topoisomerase 1
MPLRDETKLNPLVATSPPCPYCKGQMVERVAQKGRNRGKQFWGCMDWPTCRGTYPHAVGLAILEKAREDALKAKSEEAEAEARQDQDDFGFINFMDLD